MIKSNFALGLDIEYFNALRIEVFTVVLYNYTVLNDFNNQYSLFLYFLFVTRFDLTRANQRNCFKFHTQTNIPHITHTTNNHTKSTKNNSLESPGQPLSWGDIVKLYVKIFFLKSHFFKGINKLKKHIRFYNCHIE